jgi:uncharacterized protein
VSDPEVLILPGLYDSDEQHWQSLWERKHPGMRRVSQADWEAPRYSDWVAALDRAIAGTTDPLLVAHSAACALVAHWWASTRRKAIRGALLVAPADPEASSFPVGPTGFAPMPRERLPFKSIVVASRNDPYVSFERARDFAVAWGSRLVDAGQAGHISSNSGLGDWPAGLALVEELGAAR